MSSSTNTSARPKVAIIQLWKENHFDGVYAHIIDAIRARADVHIVEKTEGLTDIFMDAVGFPVALVTDAAFTGKDFALERVRAAEYVRDGGTLVFGCSFGSQVSVGKMGRLFGALRLPWVNGDYKGGSWKLNPAMIAISHAGLPDEFGCKAYNVAEV